MILEPGSARMSFSPLKSNLDDMILACEELSGQIVFFVEDAEIFGLLTEDTFCDNAPVREKPPSALFLDFTPPATTSTPPGRRRADVQASKSSSSSSGYR